MRDETSSSIRDTVFALVAMATTSAGSLAAQLPGPYLDDLRLCNSGDITVDAVMTQGPRQGEPRHVAYGWYSVAPGQCETLPHTVRTRFFGMAFKVSGTKQSVTLEENRGIELDKNSFHFIRPEELEGALGWVCIPEDFYSGFRTRFDTWNFGGSCEAGFLRFPMSNSFQLTFPVEYTRVSIRITPRLSDANRLDSRSTATPGDGGVYAGTGKDGDFHGYGVYRWPDGLHYEGEWRDNQRDGSGVLTKPDGTRCEGEWRDAVLQGTGTGRGGGAQKPCYPSGYTFTFEANSRRTESGPSSTPEPTSATSSAGAPHSEGPEASRETPDETDGATGAAQTPGGFRMLREIAVLFPVLALGYYLITRLALLLAGAVIGSVRTGGKWGALRWIHGLGAAVALALAVLTAPLVDGANAVASIFLLLGPVLLVRTIDARRYRASPSRATGSGDRSGIGRSAT